MKKLNGFAMRASKVLEVFCWIGLGLMIIATIASAIGVSWLNQQIASGEIKVSDVNVSAEIKLFEATFILEDNKLSLTPDSPKTIMGYEINDSDLELIGNAFSDALFDTTTESVGALRLTSIIPAMIVAAISCAAFAMIFRNIYLILKTANGKTPFSKGETPFQNDITRMVREIGIFLIGLFCVQLVGSFLTTFVSTNLLYLMIGILMLCLSSIFGYGEKLENDSEGLI